MTDKQPDPGQVDRKIPAFLIDEESGGVMPRIPVDRSSAAERHQPAEIKQAGLFRRMGEPVLNAVAVLRQAFPIVPGKPTGSAPERHLPPETTMPPGPEQSSTILPPQPPTFPPKQ